MSALVHAMALSNRSFLLGLTLLCAFLFLPELLPGSGPGTAVAVGIRDAITQAGAALCFYIALGLGAAIVYDLWVSMSERWRPSRRALELEDGAPVPTGIADTDLTNKLTILFVSSAMVWYELLRLRLVTPTAPLSIIGGAPGFASFLLRGTAAGIGLGLFWVSLGCVVAFFLGRMGGGKTVVDHDIGEVEVLDIGKNGELHAPVKHQDV
ncbi:hypothetical protein MKEN_01342400 [Mycena kentingensis (nom. inval.)]|nr:hypothetical protein MKEN_01342400 [Mycena kentingensis (nom. inval.)]